LRSIGHFFKKNRGIKTNTIFVVTVSLVKLFSYFRFKKVKNKFGTLIKVDFYSSFRLQKWESKNDYLIVTRGKSTDSTDA